MNKRPFGIVAFMMACSLFLAPGARALDQWDTVTPSGTSGFAFNTVSGMNDTVLLATDHGVYRSTDRGANWATFNTGLGSQDVRAIAIGWVYDAAANGGNGGYVADSATPVLAATGGGVYQTTLGGSSWTDASNGLTDTDVKDIQFDQSLAVAGAATALYAATPSGVFRSDDTGATWAAVNTGLTGQSITKLTTDFGRGTVYAITASNRLYESAAFSVSALPEDWSLAYDAGATVLRDVAMLNPIGSIHWVAAGSTVLKSNDLGTVFTSHSGGLGGSAVNTIVSDYSDSNIAFAGLAGHGVYRTQNEALVAPQWLPINKNLADTAIRDIATVPSSMLLVYATGGSGVYRLELSDPYADLTPPTAISDLSVSASTDTTVTLGWTATGDDLTTGQATAYTIRYSTAPITEGNWAGATNVVPQPTPLTSGEAETYLVQPLASGTTYYFALKATDEAGNQSALSNVVTNVAGDVTAPTAPTGLGVQ